MKRGLRVGFTGAGGTGKTTTIETLKAKYSRYEDLTVLKSASRIVYEEQNLTETIVASLTPEGKLDLQSAIFNKKIVQDDAQLNFIADRTLLDHWAYCLMYCATYMPPEAYSSLEAVARKHTLATYSHVFYFPWGYFEAPDDGVRSGSKAWQHAIDSVIVGHLVNWGIPAVEVPQSYGEDYRAEFVHNTIREEEA
jgi:predicted ATPase